MATEIGSLSKVEVVVVVVVSISELPELNDLLYVNNYRGFN